MAGFHLQPAKLLACQPGFKLRRRPQAQQAPKYRAS